MKRSFIKNSILFVLLSGALLSCNPARNFTSEKINSQGLYGDTIITDTASLADKTWNELFTDALLQNLIKEALDSNFDMRIAMQKVVEAEAYLKQSRAAFLPDVSAFGRGTYTRNSESIYPNGPLEVNSFQLGAEASWEIDIWGKLRSSKRASYDNFLATDAGKKALQTRLIADIASAYYTLMALDAKLAITNESLKNNIDLVETMQALKESGRVTGAAVVQSEATRYAAEVTIPDLEQQIFETQNALCLLSGRTGGKIERGKIDMQSPAPLIQTGVPALLLDNRPDILQARYFVMSAYENTKIARTYFYPSLTISASGGFASVKLDELLDPVSFAANIAGGLTQPIFNRRANTTRLKVARAQQEEALLFFKSSLINAGNEVQNALGSYQSAARKTELRKLQIDALEKSVEYTRELLTYGSTTYTEVLNAQTSLLAAQLSSVNDRVQELNSVVSLYRALGGGWR